MAALTHDMQRRLQQAIPSHEENIVSATQRFRTNYITVQEISQRVNVTRPTVLAKLRQRYEPILVGKTYVFERTHELEQFIAFWSKYKGEAFV